MMSTEPHDIEDEGGDARPRLSRRGWAWVITGLVALTAVTVWLSWMLADQAVRWQDVGFTVVSPTEAEVTFDVYLYEDQPVTCHVHAMNVQFAEVGVAEVDVDPAAGSEQRITLPVTTVEEANTAVVRYCAPQ